jgi:cell division protein FtsB
MTSRRRTPSTPGPGRGRSAGRPTRVTTRRTTRVAEPATEPAPSRAKLTGRTAILCLVVAVLAVSYASSVRAWLKQRSDMNTLQVQIATSRAAVAELQQAKRRWHDPAYIETQARLRFGWVMPGETGYRVIDGRGKVLTEGTSRLSAPAPVGAQQTPEWWQTEWRSIVEAGKTAAQVAAERRTHQPAARIGGRGHAGGSGGPPTTPR